jgi:hypothetical protein
MLAHLFLLILLPVFTTIISLEIRDVKSRDFCDGSDQDLIAPSTFQVTLPSDRGHVRVRDAIQFLIQTWDELELRVIEQGGGLFVDVLSDTDHEDENARDEWELGAHDDDVQWPIRWMPTNKHCGVFMFIDLVAYLPSNA